MKKIKQRIRKGETVLGCWLNLGSSLTAEIVGGAGFDWVLIDLEHGAGSEQGILHQLQALEHTGAAPVIRIEGFARQRAHRVLDLGAEGIMCPRINNPSEAEQVVKSLHYPPEGIRGVAKMVRATGFGNNFANYHAAIKEDILGIVQIETTEVLEHLDEIASLDGIDVLFIGPADLSMALGIYGQFDHPRFKEALNATINAAQKAGKATGILLFNPDDFQTYHEMGIRMIACGSDATFVDAGARRMAAQLNENRKASLEKENKM